jgi:hypothetical protein
MRRNCENGVVNLRLIFIVACRSKRALAILGLNMWSLMQNEVQQSPLNFQLAVVVDQAQFSKFVHENIHARPRRSDQRGEHILVHLYGYRFQTKVVAIIGQ